MVQSLSHGRWVHLVKYCSKGCQCQDWKEHKEEQAQRKKLSQDLINYVWV